MENSKVVNKEKQKRIEIAIAVAICLVFLIVVIINVGNSLMKTAVGQIPNQTIEGLSFENANLQVENGISKYTVEVVNDLNESIKLKTIEVVLKDEKGEELTRLVGYIGDNIDSGESKLLEASIDEEINIIPKVEYVLHK